MDTSNTMAQDPPSHSLETAPATQEPLQDLSTAELLQAAIEAARKAAREESDKTIMKSLVAYLAHAKVYAGNQLPDTTPATSSTQPPQSSTTSLHVHDHQWYSDPSDLPAHWIHQQQEYREHAYAIMISSSPPLLVHNFLQEFEAIRHRPPRPDDLPVWRVLELAPNPTTINFSRTYLPALLSLVIRLAQLKHPPIHNDPL